MTIKQLFQCIRLYWKLIMCKNQLKILNTKRLELLVDMLNINLYSVEHPDILGYIPNWDKFLEDWKKMRDIDVFIREYWRETK